MITFLKYNGLPVIIVNGIVEENLSLVGRVLRTTLTTVTIQTVNGEKYHIPVSQLEVSEVGLPFEV